MVGHDGESVEEKLALVAVAEQRRDEEFSVFGSLEVPVSFEGEDGDRVRALLVTDCGHAKESIPQGLKPLLSYKGVRAKPEGLAYLEAGHACGVSSAPASRASAFPLLGNPSL